MRFGRWNEFQREREICAKGTFWLSIGENCLPDEILSRHGVKSFSSPYSSARANIASILQFETAEPKDLFDRKNMEYVDVYGSKVVRSKIISGDPDDPTDNGITFDHHNMLADDKALHAIQRRVKRMRKYRGKRNWVFLYHHRLSSKLSIDNAVKSLEEFARIYSGNGRLGGANGSESRVIIAIIAQTIIDEGGQRRLESKQSSNGIFRFQFFTNEPWAGEREKIFALADDDLIGKMILQIQKIANDRFRD